jgi:hypothetical protein
MVESAEKWKRVTSQGSSQILSPIGQDRQPKRQGAQRLSQTVQHALIFFAEIV